MLALELASMALLASASASSRPLATAASSSASRSVAYAGTQRPERPRTVSRPLPSVIEAVSSTRKRFSGTTLIPGLRLPHPLFQDSGGLFLAEVDHLLEPLLRRKTELCSRGPRSGLFPPGGIGSVGSGSGGHASCREVQP